jgi:amino acid transporter
MAIALAAAIAALNVKLGAWVTGAFLTVEVAALLLLTGVALLHPVRPLYELIAHPVALDQGILKPVSFFTLGLATVSGVWVTAGANWAMFFGEEMHEAERKIGRVIAWVGLIAAVSIATPVIVLLMSARDLPEIFSAEAQDRRTYDHHARERGRDRGSVQ